MLTSTTDNLNYVASSKGILLIEKIPNVSIQLQRINLPGVNLPAAEHSMPMLQGYEPGEKAEFNTLSVDFILDKKMLAWKELFNWLVSIGAPSDKCTEYDHDNRFSDAVLFVQSGKNQTQLKFKFYEVWPTNIGDIEFTYEDSEDVFKKCTVEFRYLRYEIEE